MKEVTVPFVASGLACALLSACMSLPQPSDKESRNVTNADLEQRVRVLEDHAALKAVVDRFSNLADAKDVKSQSLLFTEDATVVSYLGGQQVSSLKGREQIGRAFGAYLANFDAVYHHNGQQTVEIRGDRATGVSYCYVVLVATKAGKSTATSSGVTYNDEYVRRDGSWLIAKRTSHFVWRDVSEVTAAPR
jgi:ketosteroid isomerase-like protein